MFKIPSGTKEYQQNNSSDRKGNVHITKNINFDNDGYISLSDRTRSIADSSNLSDLIDGTYLAPVLAATQDDSRFYMLSNEKIYKTTNATSYSDDVLNWEVDNATDVPTLNSFGKNDMFYTRFRTGSSTSDKMLVCNGTSTLYDRGSSAWTEINITGNANFLCQFDNLSALAYSADNIVRLIELYTGSVTPIKTLTLPKEYSITSMAYSNNRLYIATVSSKDDYCILFEWDGISDEANVGYTVNAKGVFSLDKYKNGVAFLDSNGDLFYCSGGLQKLDSFPRAKNEKRQYFVTDSPAFNPVVPRGLVVDRENIYISMNTKLSTNDGNQEDYWTTDLPSGVWCYNPTNKLHLKYTIGESQQLPTDVITTGNVDISTDIITVAGQTVPATGTQCFYFSGSDSATKIAGLDNSKRYFVIYQSDTTLKLADSYSNAIAGTAIDLTGTGNDLQFITFNKDLDYGGTYNFYGGLFLVRDLTTLRQVSPSTVNELLIGGNIQAGTSTSLNRNGLFATQTGQENRGYWITPRMESQNVLDNFKSVIKKFKKLVYEEDKIIVKYRTEDNTLPNWVDRTQAPATWVNTTSFTTTQDLSDVVIGNEVEFVAGVGAGYLAHITDITESSGTYTVTIDETVKNVVADDRVVATFSNWIKLGVITKDTPNNDLGYEQFAELNVKAKWLQIKTEFRGISIQEEELMVDNDVQLRAGK